MNKRFKIYSLLIFLFGIQSLIGQTKYNYETVPNDPSGTLIYTLDNGFKVYMSVNDKEPRVQTYFAVKAGSKYDPAETTGLAHYLEHMLFKGTHKIGSKEWESEEKILNQIADAYEEHRNEKDPKSKEKIYAKIDELSLQASKYAIANEYDKMVSSLGAKGTNAYTSNDETVYINDIPSNELEKFLFLESERFSTLVLRLFHTELETVYEEFNRSQDNDNRWAYQSVLSNLLPNHPYGTQTTIGEGEHLKNPSMYNIHNYFNSYYVPNNMALIIAGDFQPDQVVEWVETYFGDWKMQKVPTFKMPKDEDLTKPIEVKTYGPNQEMVYLGYKFDGAGSKEAMYMQIIDMLLANSQAGLIDLNLVLNQKVLSASSFPRVMKDHSVHLLYGVPKQDQDLTQVKTLLLDQIEKIKKGDFEDWLIEAVVNDLKLKQIKDMESNKGRAGYMLDAFINDLAFEKVIFEYDEMANVTKEEIVEFANKHYQDNYVVSYKVVGESKRHTVPKPTITPVDLDRESKSKFFMQFEEMQSPEVKPVFVNYNEEIITKELGEISVNYVHNKTNELFSLYYIFDTGSDYDKELALGINLLPYLSTNEYSAEELKKEFYRYGLEFGVNASADQVYVSLSGLEKNLEKGIALFEHILANVVPNDRAYKELVIDILKSRENDKLNKYSILSKGLGSYAKYGKNNPFTDRLSEEELKAIKPAQLVKKIQQLSEVEHQVFYYGQQKFEDAYAIIQEFHKNTSNLKQLEKKNQYIELEQNKNEVLFANYDMQQVELLFLSKDQGFNPELIAVSKVFNEYFGAGLSSIVFQEIREKRALAYAAYTYFSTPNRQDKSHYTQAYIGTQADKLTEASGAMIDLMNNLPFAEQQFQAAKNAVLKKIQSERITGTSIFWSYYKMQKLGFEKDVNAMTYDYVKGMEFADLQQFFDEHIKNDNYTVCVIGNKENIDFEALEKLGELRQFELNEIFGY